MLRLLYCNYITFKKIIEKLKNQHVLNERNDILVTIIQLLRLIQCILLLKESSYKVGNRLDNYNMSKLTKRAKIRRDGQALIINKLRF